VCGTYKELLVNLKNLCFLKKIGFQSNSFDINNPKSVLEYIFYRY